LTAVLSVDEATSDSFGEKTPDGRFAGAADAYDENEHRPTFPPPTTAPPDLCVSPHSLAVSIS